MNEQAQLHSDSDVAGLVARIAGFIAHGGGALTTGDVAAIRRMDPRHPDIAFIKLAALLGLPTPEKQETRWASITSGLAILGGLYSPGIRMGRALAEAGYSEFRFSRLLRADEERLVDEMPALARYLSAKGGRADWVDAAWLMLSVGRTNEERTRRRVARDYFAVSRKEA